MSSVVNYSIQGDIAVIPVENPPVNALSNAVRAALIEALARAAGDTDVAADDPWAVRQRCFDDAGDLNRVSQDGGDK